MFVFDERENYNNPTTKDRIGSALFKKVILIESREEFDREYTNLEQNEKFLLICHVFHAAKSESEVALRGVLKFNNTGIYEDYGVIPVFVSAGDAGSVMKALYDLEKSPKPVYIYSTMRDEVKAGRIQVYSKSELSKEHHGSASGSVLSENGGNALVFEYAIITALFSNEFEQIEPYFIWTPKLDINTRTKRYRTGHFVGQPDKRIVVGIPSDTGMVDTAIIATEMLNMFKPKILMMSGVCGGKEGLNFGDLVVAKKVFTFQKGKVSDIAGKDGKKVKLYNKDQVEIDYDHLYDESGKQIAISVEKFEGEQDSVLSIDSLLQDHLEPEIPEIEKLINKEIQAFGKEIKIVFEPIACSTMVINKKGYFEDHIMPVHRKVAAVEMESYGVARSTEIANDGSTKWLIFKAVMDNMTVKDDSAKKYAARISAMFLKYILERGALSPAL